MGLLVIIFRIIFNFRNFQRCVSVWGAASAMVPELVFNMKEQEEVLIRPNRHHNRLLGLQIKVILWCLAFLKLSVTYSIPIVRLTQNYSTLFKHQKANEFHLIAMQVVHCYVDLHCLMQLWKSNLTFYTNFRPMQLNTRVLPFLQNIIITRLSRIIYIYVNFNTKGACKTTILCWNIHRKLVTRCNAQFWLLSSILFP